MYYIFKLPKYLLWGREIKKNNWPLEANTGQKKRFLLNKKKKKGSKEEKQQGGGSGGREERRKEEKEDAVECGTGE